MLISVIISKSNCDNLFVRDTYSRETGPHEFLIKANKILCVVTKW